MSQVCQPVERAPVEIDARRMTPARRARIIARDGGGCTYPECGETQGLEVDHVIALGLGGRDRDDNLATLCGPHHLQKTRLDRKLIAKAERIRKRLAGERRPRQAIQGRGLGRHPTHKRGFDGKARERDL